MVKIKHSPIKEIEIFEIIKYDNIEEWEEKFLSALTSGHPVRLRWAGGVLFDYSALPSSETILKDRLNGILYIDGLHYTMMPKYQSMKTLEPPSGGIFSYSIIDVSKTTNLIELANWIKEYDKSLE